MSPGGSATRVSKAWGNSGKLIVEDIAHFMAGAYVEGIISSAMSRDEGGQISLINPTKTASGKARSWAIHNMTGQYQPDGLHFWRYPNDHTGSSTLVLTDDGKTLVQGELGIQTTIRKTRANNANLHIVSDKALYLMSKEGVNIYKCNPNSPNSCESWDNASGNLIVEGNLTCHGSINFLPTGCVIMFSGSSAPAGWAICDGGDGRPDLRGRFVLGSGKAKHNNTNIWKGDSDGKDAGYGEEDYGVGTTGGIQRQTLTKAQMPSHDHGDYGVDEDAGGLIEANACGHGGYRGGIHGGGLYDTSCPQSHRHQVEGGNQPHTNMPPYYVLLYIIKL